MKTKIYNPKSKRNEQLRNGNEVGDDVLYKCPQGFCGYELSTEDEYKINEEGVFCPICGELMLEVLN